MDVQESREKDAGWEEQGGVEETAPNKTAAL